MVVNQAQWGQPWLPVHSKAGLPAGLQEQQNTRTPGATSSSYRGAAHSSSNQPVAQMQVAPEKLSVVHLGWSLTSSKAPKPGWKQPKASKFGVSPAMAWHRMARPGISCTPQRNKTSHRHIGSYAVILFRTHRKAPACNPCMSTEGQELVLALMF